ncbi:MAG TPA: RNA methyltransferase, partial [Flavisolibacter sp.]
RRILADVLPALKEGGVLIYSTCSFSKEENEDIADWLVGEMGMECIELKTEKEWGIVTATGAANDVAGYRFYPDKVKGEGFFLSCFRKLSAEGAKDFKGGKPAVLSRVEREGVLPWIAPNSNLEFLKHEQYVFALPANGVTPFLQVQAALYIQYAGTACGMLIRGKLVPDHALALSPILRSDLPSLDLNYEDSIRYLQRNDLHLAPHLKGWQTARYKGKGLGWVNVLANRINNYYPKELRILKRENGSDSEK